MKNAFVSAKRKIPKYMALNCSLLAVNEKIMFNVGEQWLVCVDVVTSDAADVLSDELHVH